MDLLGRLKLANFGRSLEPMPVPMRSKMLLFDEVEEDGDHEVDVDEDDGKTDEDSPGQSPSLQIALLPKIPVQCTECGKTFSNKKLLQSHKTSMHPTVKCEFCEKWFGTDLGRKNHIKKHPICSKLNQQIEKNARVISNLSTNHVGVNLDCVNLAPATTISTAVAAAAAAATSTAHNNNNTSFTMSLNSSMANTNTIGRGGGGGSVKKENVEHLSVHSIQRKHHLCPVCLDDFTGKDVRQFVKHMCEAHAEQVLECAVCHQTCVSTGQLLVHFRWQHANDRSLKCLLCFGGMWMTSTEALSAHYCLSHFDEKPFTCFTCASSFSAYDVFARHRRHCEDGMIFLN